MTLAPRAKRSEVAGRHGDGWKVRVAAPPERGRANRALVELLAEVLGVARNQVSLVRGETSRQKSVEVAGLSSSEIDERLSASVRLP